MKIEDKDIDKLLEDFQGADIKVPDNLDEKLNEKLNSIKPNKKYKSVSKYLVSSVLICILSYGFIPSFRIFANNVFEYIFGDLGIENAVQNGYKGIENQTINISGYDIEISNIYIDSLRLSFDTTIKNAEVEKDKQGNYMNTYFINVVDGYELGSITVDHGLNDNRFNTNIQIIGDGITKLYNEKKDKIEIKLRLTEGQYGEIYEEEIIGEKKVLFNIPKEIYDSKTINLNKTVTDGKLKVDIKDLKIAIPKFYLSDIINEEILNKFNEVCSMLKKSGVTINIVDLPYLENSVSLYQIIALGELSSNLARFDGIKYGYSSLNASCMEEVYTKTRSEGFGEEVKRRIMVGSYLLSGVNARKYYEKALKIRKSIDNSFKNIFSSYDLMIGPTTTSYAYDLNSNNNDALKSFYDDILTNPVNMTGNPALSMPIGFSKNNLPIGLQIIGNKYDEKTIYKLASYIEKELDLNLIPGGFYEK